jgi:hypothetical protein
MPVSFLYGALIAKLEGEADVPDVLPGHMWVSQCGLQLVFVVCPCCVFGNSHDLPETDACGESFFAHSAAMVMPAFFMGETICLFVLEIATTSSFY